MQVAIQISRYFKRHEEEIKRTMGFVQKSSHKIK